MTSDWVEGQIAAYELNKAVIQNYLQSIFPDASDGFEIAVGNGFPFQFDRETNVHD